MKIEYHNGLEALIQLIDGNGIQGSWSDDGKGKHMFRSSRRGTLSYWPHTGTVLIQGKDEPKAELAKVFMSADSASSVDAPAIQRTQKAQIFVVHGHDTLALEQLELILRRLKLEPYILQNSDGQSRTLIEALEQQIHKEAVFGIVLLTPDDYGYLKSESDAERQPRARQNVILELGMVLASLGRERMVLLKKGALEMPTDISGVIYLEFNDHVNEVASRLAMRIKGSGIDIDDSLIHSAST